MCSSEPLPQNFPAESLTRTEDRFFSAQIQQVIKNAEAHRLHFMKRHYKRELLTTNLSLLAMTAGGCGFGWFFLMEADLFKALACMALAIALPLLMHIWSNKVLRTYIIDYKKSFMPEMARALGGMKFFSERGISSKILPKTGIIQPYKTYEAEDCFMGTYKGTKVIFSEARLCGKKKNGKPLFKGIFVLLEVPHKIFEGHTIITADAELVRRYATTRWSKLSKVQIQTANTSWNRFEIFSDKPEAARLMVGEKLLKELAEAADVFGNTPLTAVLFQGKYIFMAVPHERDMFEASNILVPVTTERHAMDCKKEIGQLLEIIDVFEIYQGQNIKNEA